MSGLGLVLLVIGLSSLFLFVVRLVREASMRAEPRSNGNSGRNRSHASRRDGQSSRAPTPYEVLQVRRGASRAEITSAYRRLVQQYHPDKMANMAVEFRELAERRMKEINAAYQRLKRP